MNIRTLFFIAAFLPLQALADKGDFTFKAGGDTLTIPPSCIKSVSYEKSEFGTGYISFSLTDECGEQFKKFNHKNIGKDSILSYRGNAIFSAMITQILRANFRVPLDDAPKIVLMQISNDYGIKNE